MSAKQCVICYFLFAAAIVSCAKVKVAVYEHVVVSPNDPEANFTRQEAFMWMSKNLNVFVEQTRQAAEQGVKIIVFPEYGITGFDHSRDSIVPFLEDIPDSDVNWNPCREPGRFANTLVLRNLSCTAKTYNIYIVANMGDIKACRTINDKTCPQDGRYQFNTNVVFDDDGKLIARYHKYQMYDEQSLFDPSPKAEYIYFDTPFGRFGTVVCFDIMHHQPTQVLLNKFGIKNLLVTSAMNIFPPFLVSQQIYAGLAKKMQINVIASNVRNSEYQMAGSGIFGDKTQVLSDINTESTEGVLLVAEIESNVTDKFTHVKLSTIKNFGEMNKTYDGIYHFGMNMTYAILEGHSGFLKACKEDVCCAVTYQFRSRDENEKFILSVVDKVLSKPGIIHMQYCAVFKCSPGTKYSCNYHDLSVNSVFEEIKIQGYFGNGVLFPLVSTVSSNAMNQLYMDMDKYIFDDKNAILYSDQFERPLLAAVLFNTHQHADVKIGASSNDAVSTSLTGISYVLILVCFKHLN